MPKCGPFDFCTFILKNVRGARKEKIDEMRHSKQVEASSKFKILVSGNFADDILIKILREHLNEHDFTIKSFQNLAGEVVFQDSRFFITFFVTQTAAVSYIDGSIAPL